MNWHCPGGITWSDEILILGWTKKWRDENKKPPSIGNKRGGWIAPSPTVKGGVRHII